MITDRELLDQLMEIDESDAEVTSWEAGFIETVCYEQTYNLSERQIKTAENIIEKYADYL